MPKCFSAFGYVVFFWSNENEPLEPVHVHIAQKISANATKIWILSDGSAELEMHEDAILPGQKVVLVDDLIATGGTVEACAKMIEQLGGEVVKIIFLMELAGLKGREKLQKYDVASVITYEGK